MQIVSLQKKPIHRIQFLNAAKGGGVKSQILSIIQGRVDKMPTGLKAILLTSDLQGVVQVWQLGKTRLLGEELANEYIKLSEQGIVPQPGKTGVILAGDFYSAPDGAKRGASGDVRTVWQAFADNFRWVAGVQGNHDRFGSKQEKQKLVDHPKINLFDYESVTLDNLCLGGVSGIIGDPAKPGRREESNFLSGLELVLESAPDILILHQGPNGGELQPGNELVKETIMKNSVPLIVCGHVHWDEELATIGQSTQIINVDSRAIVLTH